STRNIAFGSGSTMRPSTSIAPSLAITSTFLAANFSWLPAFLNVYYLVQPTRDYTSAYTIVIAYALADGFPNMQIESSRWSRVRVSTLGSKAKARTPSYEESARNRCRYIVP